MPPRRLRSLNCRLVIANARTYTYWALDEGMFNGDGGYCLLGSRARRGGIPRETDGAAVRSRGPSKHSFEIPPVSAIEVQRGSAAALASHFVSAWRISAWRR